MPKLTVGNATVPYRVVGSGPALVLVHGVGPGSSMWDLMLDAFTDHRTVLLPDLSGGDPAEDDGSPLTIETLAGQVNAVIENFGAGPADVVGFSLGAPTAAAAAALRPDLVRRLVPVAGLSHAGDEYVQQYMTAWSSLAGSPESFGRFATLTAFSRAFLNRIGHDAVEQQHAFMGARRQAAADRPRQAARHPPAAAPDRGARPGHRRDPRPDDPRREPP
ncbi:alpha/beta fold hydrolase [Actinomadura luteofluorescens]|uniref:alpha/beta fold hydrolase n=1 Tax=Actinomadura luteofluorescens TaxID=46163 RepID=UPI00363411A4